MGSFLYVFAEKNIKTILATMNEAPSETMAAYDPYFGIKRKHPPEMTKNIARFPIRISPGRLTVYRRNKWKILMNENGMYTSANMREIVAVCTNFAVKNISKTQLGVIARTRNIAVGISI